MPRTEPPEKMARFFDPQQSNQGEKTYSPTLDYDIDAMLEDLGSRKRDLVLEGKGLDPVTLQSVRTRSPLLNLRGLPLEVRLPVSALTVCSLTFRCITLYDWHR